MHWPQRAQFSPPDGVTHPSQPNYRALFSGSARGVTDDSCPVAPSAVWLSLASQLLAAAQLRASPRTCRRGLHRLQQRAAATAATTPGWISIRRRLRSTSPSAPFPPISASCPTWPSSCPTFATTCTTAALPAATRLAGRAPRRLRQLGAGSREPVRAGLGRGRLQREPHSIMARPRCTGSSVGGWITTRCCAARTCGLAALGNAAAAAPSSMWNDRVFGDTFDRASRARDGAQAPRRGVAETLGRGARGPAYRADFSSGAVTAGRRRWAPAARPTDGPATDETFVVEHRYRGPGHEGRAVGDELGAHLRQGRIVAVLAARSLFDAPPTRVENTQSLIGPGTRGAGCGLLP